MRFNDDDGWKPRVFVKPSPEVALAEYNRSRALVQLQSSLFARLRNEWGPTEGAALAWSLAFLSKPENKRHACAVKSLALQTLPELLAFIKHAQESARVAKTEEWRELAKRVVSELEKAIAQKYETPSHDEETGELLQ